MSRKGLRMRVKGATAEAEQVWDVDRQTVAVVGAYEGDELNCLVLLNMEKMSKCRW